MIILDDGMVQFEHSLYMKEPVPIFGAMLVSKMHDYYPFYIPSPSTGIVRPSPFLDELNTIYILYYKGTDKDPEQNRIFP